MDSGLSNFTAKRLNSDCPLSKWLRSVPCLIFYSCSPRNKTFKLWRLNAALLKPTWSLENRKWKRQLFPTGDLRYHIVSIRWNHHRTHKLLLLPTWLHFHLLTYTHEIKVAAYYLQFRHIFDAAVFMNIFLSQTR